MAQSLVKNHMHIIFSTKHRQPFIGELIEAQLYRYMAGICTELECPPIIVGGYDDHVHILCMLSKKLALAKLLELVKSHSSKWIKQKGLDLLNFYWQDGYGAFSVSSSHVKAVVKYIQNQRSHHTKQGFQDEFRALLNKNNVDFNERYVWD